MEVDRRNGDPRELVQARLPPYDEPPPWIPPHEILSVNRVNFESIEHKEAVKVLKHNTRIQMTVRYFPYGYERTYDKSRYLASNQGMVGQR